MIWILIDLIVSDFVWSLSNDTILSCSLDGSSRLWQVASGQCLRVITNPNESEVLACLFQPINNNLFAVSFFLLDFLFWKISFASVRMEVVRCVMADWVGLFNQVA